MVEFDFYVNSYLGSKIPEKAFPAVAAQAAAALCRMEKIYRVQAWGEDSRKMAVCAMAETLYDAERRHGLRSAGVGNVSVQYRDETAGTLWRELYNKAGIYLDIYRGAER